MVDVDVDVDLGDSGGVSVGVGFRNSISVDVVVGVDYAVNHLCFPLLFMDNFNITSYRLS